MRDFDTREHLSSTNPEESADHRVGYAVYRLQTNASHLWKMRLDPETADQVMTEEGSILAALAMLQTLAEDLRAARVKNEELETIAAE